MAKIPHVNIDKIKDLCKSKGLTMKFLCDQIARDRTYFANIRSGKTRIDDDEIEFIAHMLDTTVDYLTDLTDQKEKPTELPADAIELNSMLLRMTDEQIARLKDLAKDILGE
ncbi:MAG: helix-turn-helix transcriptional regulator [Clostridia bacterium]|nr:helix-turn-helix transcriptional regulator [Clostridia bacterium]